MIVRNIHARHFNAPREQVGSLLDGLASSADRLWPAARWPPMRFDRPLQVGATGGHGPIRYRVEAYEPGVKVRFRLQGPSGFDGYHAFEVLPAAGGTTLQHALEMRARGSAMITWPLLFSPLHDALIEDCLDMAARELGEAGPHREYSRRVRLLRAGFRLLRRRAPDA